MLGLIYQPSQGRLRVLKGDKMLGFKTSSLVLPVPASSATLDVFRAASELEETMLDETIAVGDLYALPEDRWMDYQRLMEWMNDFVAFSPLVERR